MRASPFFCAGNCERRGLPDKPVSLLTRSHNNVNDVTRPIERTIVFDYNWNTREKVEVDDGENNGGNNYKRLHPSGKNAEIQFTPQYQEVLDVLPHDAARYYPART
jgi:hypothetical protein